jgi:hypothetical protein
MRRENSEGARRVGNPHREKVPHPGRAWHGRRCDSARDRRRRTAKFFAGARSRRAERGGELRVRPRIGGWRRKAPRKGGRRGTGEARQRRFIDCEAEFGRGRVEVEDFLEALLFFFVYLESEGSNLSRDFSPHYYKYKFFR